MHFFDVELERGRPGTVGLQRTAAAMQRSAPPVRACPLRGKSARACGAITFPGACLRARLRLSAPCTLTRASDGVAGKQQPSKRTSGGAAPVRFHPRSVRRASPRVCSATVLPDECVSRSRASRSLLLPPPLSVPLRRPRGERRCGCCVTFVPCVLWSLVTCDAVPPATLPS